MIDISNDMTKEFYKDKKFKKGSVLIFDFEGSKTEFKIIRLNRAKRICHVVETRLYTEQELKDELGYE